MVVTGWGKLSYYQKNTKVLDTGAYVDILQRVIVPITNDIPNCAGSNVDSTQICAGGIEGPNGKYKGKDSCSADSGGPLHIRDLSDDPWYQTGLVSFGPKVCASPSPGVYTNVNSFLPWIKETLED